MHKSPASLWQSLTMPRQITFISVDTYHRWDLSASCSSHHHHHLFTWAWFSSLRRFRKPKTNSGGSSAGEPQGKFKRSERSSGEVEEVGQRFLGFLTNLKFLQISEVNLGQICQISQGGPIKTSSIFMQMKNPCVIDLNLPQHTSRVSWYRAEPNQWPRTSPPFGTSNLSWEYTA